MEDRIPQEGVPLSVRHQERTTEERKVSAESSDSDKDFNASMSSSSDNYLPQELVCNKVQTLRVSVVPALRALQKPSLISEVISPTPPRQRVTL